NGDSLPYRQPAHYRSRVLDHLFHDNFICFSSVMVKRQVLEHVGRFDPGLDLAIDYDLWLRIAKHYAVDFVDEPLVQYLTGHANLSRRLGERLKTAFWIMRRFQRRYGGIDHVDDSMARRSFAQTCCSMALALRPYSPKQSASWFLNAVRQKPSLAAAWRGLFSLMLPNQFRVWLRAIRGGANWELAYHAPENDPNNL